jgi:spermidine synthase
VTAILWPCFALSGAAALGLELLWMRSAALVLGTTAPTAAAVLACYFTGLGVGAWSARGVASRPIVRYGLLELAAAAGALWSLAVFRVPLVPGVAAVPVAILPTTLCLGATLPVLGQVLAAGRVGTRGGLLQAANTAGGGLGIAVMGFGLPALVGVTWSYLVVAAASALTGCVALAVRDVGVAPPERTAERPPASTRARLRVVAAGTGALGLGLEVLWVRLFAQVLHNSVYSFAAVVLVFLLALAAGAALAALLLRRLAAPTIAAAALVAAAAATVGGLWVFTRLTDGLAYVGMQTGLGEYVARILALAALTAGPGALASGAVLPALWELFGERDRAARPLGELGAANTFGAVVGAVAAGFVVLPRLGLRGGFLLAGIAYVVLADLIAPRRTPLRPLGYVVLLAIAVLDPLRAPLAHLAAGETLRSFTEGPSGVVTVVGTSDDLQLRLDGYYVLGGTAAATTERRQGLLPLLLHPAPRDVLFVGMATGITASAGPALGVERTTVVELVPEVAAAADAHFGAWNAALLRRPDVRLVVGDGRRHLAATGERYDVVVSDLFVPWHAGAGSLYAREMFETVARRLAMGGLFCQWLPLYQLTREEFDTIARTFLAVFPRVTVWRNDFYPDRPVLALVGQLAPRPLDIDAVTGRLARLPEWARDPLLATPRGLVMLYVGDLSAGPDLLASGPLNTDDLPLIEFGAPRLTRIGAGGDKDWFTDEALASFAEALAARADSDAVLPASDGVAAARQAGAALYRYALAARRGDDVEATRREAEVRRLVPDVVALGDSAPSVATLADTRRVLGTLRTEQERMARELDAMERRLGAMAR